MKNEGNKRLLRVLVIIIGFIVLGVINSDYPTSRFFMSSINVLIISCTILAFQLINYFFNPSKDLKNIKRTIVLGSILTIFLANYGNYQSAVYYLKNRPEALERRTNEFMLGNLGIIIGTIAIVLIFKYINNGYKKECNN